MKKLFMLIGAAFVLVLLGIGIYQTDASQKGRMLSEDEITKRISAQYPGEITAIEQQADNYKLDIEHAGVAYELIVNGYDGKVIELIEKGTLKTEKEAEPEETDDTEQQPSPEPEEESEPEDTPDEDQDSHDMETTIVKNESEPKEEKQDKKADKPQEKEEKPEKQQEKPKKKEEKNQEKEEEKEKKQKQKQEEKEEEKAKTVISESEAANIALKEFPGDIEEIELDEDDDRLIYEIEIVRDELEAELEIDAYSGEIIYIEIDD